MFTDGGETKAPSATFHSVAPPDLDCATISIWPLMGRLNCCPLAARYFCVPLCLSFTALSRRQGLFPPQITSQTSIASPAPSLPYAETSWLFVSGALCWCEWRFFMVLMWVRRTSLPHMTESPRLQLSSDAPRIHQYELESVSPRKPVTDCWPEPDPYVTSWLCTHCVSFVD